MMSDLLSEALGELYGRMDAASSEMEGRNKEQVQSDMEIIDEAIDVMEILKQKIIELAGANQQLRIDNAELDMISKQDCEIAKNKIESLEQQVKELQDSKECTWHLDDADMWEASCGYACTINEGTPEQNEMKYCCSCGGKLITPPQEEVL